VIENERNINSPFLLNACSLQMIPEDITGKWKGQNDNDGMFVSRYEMPNDFSKV